MAGYSPFGDYLGLSGALFSAKMEMEMKKQNVKDRQLNRVNGLTPVTIRETLQRPLNTTQNTTSSPVSSLHDSTYNSTDSGLRWPRPRYASWSSVDTDISDDCVSADLCLRQNSDIYTPVVTGTDDGSDDARGDGFRQRSHLSAGMDVEDRDFVCVTGDSKFRFFLPNIPDSSGRPILPQKPELRPEDNAKQQQQYLQQQQHQSVVRSGDIVAKPRETIYANDDLEVMSSVSDVRSSLHRYEAPPEVSASSMGGMMERFVTEVVEKRFRDRFQRPTICVFCQRNGETVEYYSTHVLKDSRGKVICPILRNYVCPKCKATGDNAHTLRHCPESRCQASVSETFKTPRTSCGLRKF